MEVSEVQVRNKQDWEGKELEEYGLSQYKDNLKRRFDIMRESLQDRRGVMCHGTFVKEKNLNELSKNGVNFDEVDCCFKGVLYLESQVDKVDSLFKELGFSYTSKGTFTQGVVVVTRGVL